MKKMNERSKGEQLFFMMLVLTGMLGVFCLVGCGGCIGDCLGCGDCSKCEMPKLKCETGDGCMIGCSIPGCGGVLTPGKGYGCAAWPQSIKTVVGCHDSEERYYESNYKIFSCDSEYYEKSGCCNTNDRTDNCIGGLECSKREPYDSNEKTDKFCGLTCGDGSSAKKYGCANGCIGCFEVGKLDTYNLETEIGIR